MIFLILLLLDVASREITFVYRPDHAVKSVTVVGSFNSWNKGATPLHSTGDGTVWTVRIPVPYGHQEYKFVVDDTDWIVDPKGKAIDDGNGHQNTLLLVAPPDFDIAASPNDGVVAASAVLHQQTASYLNYDRGSLTLRLRTRANDVSSVEMFSTQGFNPMRLVSSDELYSTFETRLPWNRATDLNYSFRLKDGEKAFWYGPKGLSESKSEGFVLDAKAYKPFEVAPWVEKSVIYQIFPDRFANGDPSNDPADVQAWDAKPTYSNRFGGDVAGVRKHLDYLSKLGIDAVYFNPVFKSPSNHRYDASSYLELDPQFGTNAEFGALTAAMKARGIRTVMDIAFNHTAVDAPQFLDIRKNGAASPYTNWYFIKSYPVEVKENPPYVAWFNYPSMPKLNVMNPATHQYLLDVLHYWLKNAPGVSGYRFDVANEIDQRFWRDARKDLKGIDPNIWLVGEEWGDASQWLQGDQWDASMDYPFREACLGFFATQQSSASQFAQALMANYNRYAPQVSRNMMNLLGSHDTARFLTLCKGDVASDELAAAVQFTWVGAPSIYYGDEIGMQGGVDPDNRKGMVWSEANDANPVLEFYKKLIRIRKSSSALQSGDPRILQTNDANSTFAYARELDDDLAVVAVNRSSSAQTIFVQLPETAPYSTALRQGFLDALSGRRFSVTGHELTLSLAAKSAVILRPLSSHVSSTGHQRRSSVLDHLISPAS
jgi:glycosidase